MKTLHRAVVALSFALAAAIGGAGAANAGNHIFVVGCTAFERANEVARERANDRAVPLTERDCFTDAT